MSAARYLTALLTAALLLPYFASAHAPGVAVQTPESCIFTFADSSMEKYRLYGNEHGVPLERFLWKAGAYPVTGILVGDTRIDWAGAAYGSKWYIPVTVEDSHVNAFGRTLSGSVQVETMQKPAYTILDVVPTASEALGLPVDGFEGRSLVHANATQVVIIYADALGWYRYTWARDHTLNISSLGQPLLAASVYPSISNVNAAAMLTGVSPEKSGVDRWGYRHILAPTSLELASRHGVSAAWVDNERPPVVLQENVIRVPDQDGDGTPDDEVATRAISEYDNGKRLLYVHLVQADRELHETGPYSTESWQAIMNIDTQVGRILEHVRPGTMVILVSDHGGHDVQGGKGDHGTLLPQDMLIPIFIRTY